MCQFPQVLGQQHALRSTPAAPAQGRSRSRSDAWDAAVDARLPRRAPAGATGPAPPRMDPALRRLWMTAGGLFVFGYVFKYVTWVSVQSQVEETNRITHEDASRQLTQARADAQRFALPPLVKPPPPKDAAS